MKLQDAHWYTAEMREDLEKARAKTAAIRRLGEEADDLVEGYAKEVMTQISLAKPEDREDIEIMINNIPDGLFHRMELKTALNEALGRQTTWLRPSTV